MFISMIGVVGSSPLPNQAIYAQPVNDRDFDGTDDELDLCPDDPYNQCKGETGRKCSARNRDGLKW